MKKLIHCVGWLSTLSLERISRLSKKQAREKRHIEKGFVNKPEKKADINPEGYR